MMDFRDRLTEVFSGEGLNLTETQKDQFQTYRNLLVEWNEKINLTAITDDEGIIVKHFLDSAILLNYWTPGEGAILADVGTGAGFPSIPLKILRTDLQLTLIDSLNKRIRFLEEVGREISLSMKTVHIRGEEAGRKPEFREKFDAVSARAVANLRMLSEYCLPLVKPGGIFLAMKGYEVEEEMAEAALGIKHLGGKREAIHKFSLPGEEKRSLLLIKKISQTPPKYPRPSGKIVKAPL